MNDRIKRISGERDRLSLWANASNTAFGQQVLREFERRRELARDAYRHIPAAAPDALTLLIEAQQAEQIFSGLIQAIEDNAKRKIELDKELENAISEYNRSQSVSRERDIYTGGKDD